ncbi:hypothetical protein [Streptomyces sp. RK9]|uniref:hypothetical protein n=1 Tax=Streptomyces sp. RK9 TaxID=3239284 RepID=UPI0038684C65
MRDEYVVGPDFAELRPFKRSVNEGDKRDTDGATAALMGVVLAHEPRRRGEAARRLHLRAAERGLAPLRHVPASGWSEVHGPGRHHPQMDALAGLAVVAPLAFFAARLALTRTVPFAYSFDDHGPGHYVDAQAPPGVLSEYGDVR